jgi:hypothetical protein
MAVGGMKRIVINLVMNSLKYTSAGNILVKLSIMPPHGAMKRPSAVLSVSDSGRGMSQEFLDHSLYRAFTQESDLNEGTGLGMNMVAKIIKAMGGTIKVQSEKNQGTITTVTMPLEMSKYDTKLAYDELQRTANAFVIPALDISFLGTSIPEDRNVMNDSHRLQVSMLRKTCSEYLNIILPSPCWELSEEAAFALILESDLPQLQRILEADTVEASADIDLEAVNLMRNRPLVIVCRDYTSVRRIKASSLIGLIRAKVECISQPCGPNRLAAAFQKCLDSLQDKERAATSSDSSDALLLPPFTLPNRDTRENSDAPTKKSPHALAPLPHLRIRHGGARLEVPNLPEHSLDVVEPIERTSSRKALYPPQPQPDQDAGVISPERTSGSRASISSTTSSHSGTKIPLLL